jgi:hypothetical protein
VTQNPVRQTKITYRGRSPFHKFGRKSLKKCYFKGEKMLDLKEF